MPFVYSQLVLFTFGNWLPLSNACCWTTALNHLRPNELLWAHKSRHIFSKTNRRITFVLCKQYVFLFLFDFNEILAFWRLHASFVLPFRFYSSHKRTDKKPNDFCPIAFDGNVKTISKVCSLLLYNQRIHWYKSNEQIKTHQIATNQLILFPIKIPSVN